MKKKSLKITLEKAKELYKGDGSPLDELLLSSFDKEDLQKKDIKQWGDLPNINGYYVENASRVFIYDDNVPSMCCNKNVFATEEQAEACIAMAMLSQLMKHVNEGSREHWINRFAAIYVIYPKKNDILVEVFTGEKRRFLSFKSREIANKFLEDHVELIGKARPLL